MSTSIYKRFKKRGTEACVYCRGLKLFPITEEQKEISRGSGSGEIDPRRNDISVIYPHLNNLLSRENEKFSLYDRTKSYHYNCPECGFEKTLDGNSLRKGKVTKCRFCTSRLNAVPKVSKEQREISLGIRKGKVDKSRKDLWARSPEIAKELVNPEEGFLASCNSKKKLQFKCSLGHTWFANTNSRTYYKCGCPFCSNREIWFVSKEQKTFSINEEFDKVDLRRNDFYALRPEYVKFFKNTEIAFELTSTGAHRKFKNGIVIDFVCEYGHEWKAKINHRKKDSFCPICNKYNTSAEKELFNFVKSSIPDYQVLSSNRTIIAPKELDIVIPELDIAIEFNGDYWHSDKKFLETRGLTAFEVHSEKLELARVAGFSLYFVWWSDWISSRQEVERALIDLFESGVSSVPLLTTLSKD